MAKPILLVRLKSGTDSQERQEAADLLSARFGDYHVITTTGKADIVEIEVHNAINATDIEIDDLKQMVLKQTEA